MLFDNNEPAVRDNSFNHSVCSSVERYMSVSIDFCSFPENKNWLVFVISTVYYLFVWCGIVFVLLRSERRSKFVLLLQ